MSVYHQMGHNSTNLLSEAELNRYRGAILSPVNEDQSSISQLAQRFQSDNFKLIFDPQLYYPNTQRGELPNWSYFPEDVDTVDHGSLQWWANVNDGLVDILSATNVRAVCSPAVVPRTYSPSYYDLNRQIANDLKEKLCDTDVIQTLLVKMEYLQDNNVPEMIASIVSECNCDRIYLVFVSDVEPRRELGTADDLKGALRLIHFLKAAELEVLVGCVSSDIILWKAAGADHCATGKFFNLRRFTPSRFEPPAGGGGQLPYWFEESLMGFLRESDLLRLPTAHLSQASQDNPFCQAILAQRESDPESAWVALSWRQYMYWFQSFEDRYNQGLIAPNRLLASAERIWLDLDDNDILMEEARNNGEWLRPWRRALAEYRN